MGTVPGVPGVEDPRVAVEDFCPVDAGPPAGVEV